jgi:small subunit ribosomal protein S12
MTLNQLVYKRYFRIKKYHRCRTVALQRCPQKKGTILSVVIVAPKKPNSAKRQIVRVHLSTGKIIRASIPGIKSSHKLKQFGRVLIRGGRIRDVIGLRYRIILNKYDAKPFLARTTSRSKYGVLARFRVSASRKKKKKKYPR